MAKELYFAELFEQYEKLLNPHRRKIAYEYYILDLSLGRSRRATAFRGRA